jgi:predicted SAM-dependent methyltransferase
MPNLKDASVEAVYSSHNIEHLYAHEVPLAMAEFKRVLKPKGFVVLTCPDLQSVCAAIAEDKLTDSLYTSPAGPITPFDVVFGWRAAIAAGNVFMAHRSGFTQKVLLAQFQLAGFTSIAAIRRPHPFYDLWVLASVEQRTEVEMQELAQSHLPVKQT